MATLTIVELSRLPIDERGTTVPVADLENVTAIQAVSFTTTAASAAFHKSTKYVRVYSDADCFIDYGTAPVATTGHIPMAADSPEYFGVASTKKIAAYDGIS